MSEPEGVPRPISPGDAARRLGVSTRTVQRWLRESRLPAVRVGDRLKVDPAAFADDARAEGTGQARASASVPKPAAAPGAATVRQIRPIRRLLVANRGELPVRIAKTCRRLGITSIALVAPDQARAWWPSQLDERQPLNGTYLDPAAILEAARAAAADAIHPGYGFLAENADFADAVGAAGFIWVGPPAGAMRALGDKAAGRRLAASVDVPTLTGYDGTDQDDETLRHEAARIGYPVLIKPSAGGGGKGMHVATGDAELTALLAQARREARGAFGDERLVLERYVEHPRHVEVQLLLDQHGNGVHLGERDCSLQRRHQKVIEEAPSPAVDSVLRARLGEAALRLANAAGYVGAGTAEFLLDSQRNFFFLEVNARLQVEHPVTEAVTGRDLVEDQLRVAAGEPLGFAQSDVTWSGHAIEARLYAEDAWAGFLPATGTIIGTRWPDGPRVDRGIETGDDVGTRYDPLLAKLVCHANDRRSAIDALDRALADTSTLGVTTNRGFLRTLLSLDRFADGNATTDLIEREWRPDGDPPLDSAWQVAAAAIAEVLRGSGGAPPGFRLNARPRLLLRIGEQDRSVPVPDSPGETPWALDPASESPTIVIDLDGLSVRARLAPAPTVEAAVSHAQRAEGSSLVVAPMPGVVLHVRVSEGDAVEAGQVLVVLEAMKMENGVTAPSPGTVARVSVLDGAQVARGDLLVELR